MKISSARSSSARSISLGVNSPNFSSRIRNGTPASLAARVASARSVMEDRCSFSHRISMPERSARSVSPRRVSMSDSSRLSVLSNPPRNALTSNTMTSRCVSAPVADPFASSGEIRYSGVPDSTARNLMSSRTAASTG